ncbi:MAG: hypothetical protein AAGM67_05290, partial [Bacteroidota bacterium]
DSLQLQQDIYHLIEFKNRKGHILARTNFELEDYELSRLDFAFRVDSNQVFRGSPLQVYASATDENDLPSPDARIKLSLTFDPSRPIEWQSEQVFLPQELWQYEGALDPVGETRIVIPDSIWPEAIFAVRLEARLFSSDQESKSFVETLRFRHQKPVIAFADVGDSLYCFAKLGQDTLDGPARMHYLDSKGDLLAVDSIWLPSRVPLRGTLRFYQLHFGEQIGGYEAVVDKLELMGQRTRDSLLIQHQNPRGIPFWYSLFRGNRLLAEGTAVDFPIKRAVGEKEDYFLGLRYLWGGKVISKNYRFRWYPNRVNVSLQHPAQASPGALVPITVSVKDVDDAPLVDFDLALYGWTSKFDKSRGTSIPIYAPQWPARKIRREFAREQAHSAQSWSKKLAYGDWNKRAQLDTIPWYQFRYPGGAIYRDSFPIEDTVAQFAPFVFRQGLQVKPFLIYLDGRPVYWHRQYGPFAFRAEEGYHSIDIRIWDRTIKMDSLWLSAGHKTILSVDQEALPAEVSWRSAKPELSAQEKDLIRRYYQYYYTDRNQKLNLSQGPVQHKIGGGSYKTRFVLGPFFNKRNVSVEGEHFAYEIPAKRDQQHRLFASHAIIEPQPLFFGKRVRLWPDYGEPFNISAVSTAWDFGESN